MNFSRNILFNFCLVLLFTLGHAALNFPNRNGNELPWFHNNKGHSGPNSPNNGDISSDDGPSGPFAQAGAKAQIGPDGPNGPLAKAGAKAQIGPLGSGDSSKKGGSSGPLAQAGAKAQIGPLGSGGSGDNRDDPIKAAATDAAKGLIAASKPINANVDIAASVGRGFPSKTLNAAANAVTGTAEDITGAASDALRDAVNSASSLIEKASAAVTDPTKVTGLVNDFNNKLKKMVGDDDDGSGGGSKGGKGGSRGDDSDSKLPCDRDAILGSRVLSVILPDTYQYARRPPPVFAPLTVSYRSNPIYSYVTGSRALGGSRSLDLGFPGQRSLEIDFAGPRSADRVFPGSRSFEVDFAAPRSLELGFPAQRPLEIDFAAGPSSSDLGFPGYYPFLDFYDGYGGFYDI